MSDLLIKSPLIYEPLRKNRWILRFPSDLGIQEWTVESAKRPKITIKPTEIQFLNTSTWVAGRYTWDDITVTFRDMIGPSTSQAVMEWVRLCAESVTGRMGYAIGYKRDIELEMLDPTGAVAQRWVLVNAWLTDVDGSDLNYNADDISTLSCTMKMDYAILAF